MQRDRTWKQIAARPYEHTEDWSYRDPMPNTPGDCEDHAVAFVELCQDPDSAVVYAVMKPSSGIRGYHAFAKWHALYLEPQVFGRFYTVTDFEKPEFIAGYDQVILDTAYLQSTGGFAHD